jgi:hypothetical protein
MGLRGQSSLFFNCEERKVATEWRIKSSDPLDSQKSVAEAIAFKENLDLQQRQTSLTFDPIGLTHH